METLQEKILNDLKHATENKDNVLAGNIKVIVGELQRQPKKILSDDVVMQIIKKLIKYELEVLERTNVKTSDYFETLQSYIPKQLDETEIKEWIKENIDFSQFKNKMQAVGIVVKQFGQSVDGNKIKQIIQEM
jgi:uncharacterized protein